MKKIIMMLTLTIGINIIPVFGLSMRENNADIKDTFRIYVTNPMKI